VNSDVQGGDNAITGVNLGAPEGKAVPAPLVAPVVLIELQIRSNVEMKDSWASQLNISYIAFQLHQWCNGQRALLECDMSWVRDPTGTNRRL
jgi:hypothetical protein